MFENTLIHNGVTTVVKLERWQTNCLMLSHDAIDSK